MLGGGGLIATGELLSQVPGMQYPARIGLGFPGAAMIGRGLKQGATAARDAFNRPSIAPPDTPPVTPYAPFRTNPRTAAKMEFGGSVKPEYQPGPSGGGVAARRPGGLPEGGIGPRRVEVQHLGDMRINGRTPEPLPMFDAYGRKLPRP